MSDQVEDVQFSGENNNTLVAIALVTGVLSLALNFYTIQRTNEISQLVSLMTIQAAQAQ
jgi:hypothetical protein